MLKPFLKNPTFQSYENLECLYTTFYNANCKCRCVDVFHPPRCQAEQQKLIMWPGVFKRCSSIWHCDADKIQPAGFDHMQWWTTRVPAVLPPLQAQSQEMQIYEKTRQTMLAARGCQVLRVPLRKSKAHWRLLVNFQSCAPFFKRKAGMWEQPRAVERLTDRFISWNADFFSQQFGENAVSAWPSAIAYCHAALSSQKLAI